MGKYIKLVKKKTAILKWKKEWKKEYKKARLYIDINRSFNNSAKKKRCFILGNGPSIKSIDFSIFDNEDVFTVNQITRNDNFFKLHPRFHFWADPMFFYEKDNHEPAISNEFFSKMIEIYNNNNEVSVFAVSHPSNAVCREITQKHPLYFYCSYGSIKNYMDSPFDLSKPCPSFYNVVQYAIYTAMAIGYKEIYLLGCEQSNIIMILTTLLQENSTNYQYGYDVNTIESQRMISQYNRFPVSVWLKEHSLMFKDFEYLKKIADKNNIKIYNCTKATLVKCFGFVSIDSIFSKEN